MQYSTLHCTTHTTIIYITYTTRQYTMLRYITLHLDYNALLQFMLISRIYIYMYVYWNTTPPSYIYIHILSACIYIIYTHIPFLCMCIMCIYNVCTITHPILLCVYILCVYIIYTCRSPGSSRSPLAAYLYIYIYLYLHPPYLCIYICIYMWELVSLESRGGPYKGPLGAP
jgi:hypothetical protein